MQGVIKAQARFSRFQRSDPLDPPVEISRPKVRTTPWVFASPHSGRAYPSEFLKASALAAPLVRASEDAYVDELFAAAPCLGAPLVRAVFPRAYVDVNRHPLELDPDMFVGRLSQCLQPRSPRAAAGLGAVPRIVGDGLDLYDRPLPAAEAERRLRRCHHPYHDALGAVLAETRAHFHTHILVDCHSMPSAGHGHVDVVLGDRFGSSCAGDVTDLVEAALRAEGLRVTRNTPYAGGYSTERYGRTAARGHAIQIELNRGLYLHEATVERRADFPALRTAMTRVMTALLAAELTLAA